MKKKIDVTVIIPFYKKLRFFHRTYESLLSQTYKNFKVIIIYDDNDKSDLLELNKIIKDKRFKILINKKNIGVGQSRNNGIKKVKTKYVAFLDSDDYWDKNKLKIQLSFMKKFNISFSHTSYHIVNEKGLKLDSIIINKIIKYRDLLKSCDIGLSSVITETKLFNKNKFPGIKTKEDYVLWLIFAKKKINIIGLNQKLTFWRKTRHSLSSNTLRKLKDAFSVYYRFQKFGMIISFIFTLRLSINYLIKHKLKLNFRL